MRPTRRLAAGALHAENSRDEVLAAAAEAFMLNGFAATSIDDVADILGATKGRVYHYYRSKTDLFLDVHASTMEMNLAAIRPIAEGAGSALERLQRMAYEHVLLLLTRRSFQRVSIQGLEMHAAGRMTPAGRRKLGKIIGSRDAYEALFREVLKQATAGFSSPLEEPRIVVKALLGALNWTTIWYAPKRGETVAAREKIARTVSRYAVNGLWGGPK